MAEGRSLHHPKETESYHLKLEAWGEKLANNRCCRCWLRVWECYCKARETKPEDEYPCEAEVVIYYHYSEIGRSPNTAHLLPIIAPQLVHSTMTFCNVHQESSFLDLVRLEKEQGIERTCILYPTHDAVFINDWNKQRKCDLPPRLVLLDGTYSMSTKQLKFIQNHFDNVVPIVKLDLGTGCRSAIAGIMEQPALDKICSYQAVAIALQQLGIDANYCAFLLKELDLWLAYILRKKVGAPVFPHRLYLSYNVHGRYGSASDTRSCR